MATGPKFDSRCWLELEASTNGPSLFPGSTRARYHCDDSRHERAKSRATLQHRRVVGATLGQTSARNRQSEGEADGRYAAVRAGGPPPLDRKRDFRCTVWRALPTRS